MYLAVQKYFPLNFITRTVRYSYYLDLEMFMWIVLYVDITSKSFIIADWYIGGVE
jgi:hypothetical protein